MRMVHAGGKYAQILIMKHMKNLIYENKSMAEFLESLGYSQEQISHIANGGCPKSEIELLREEVTEMEKQPMANASAIERFKAKD